MKLYHPDNRHRSETHKRIYAMTELAYTLNDVGAAALFVVGSILFFSPSTTYAGTWLVLVGSIMFGVRPLIKLSREIRYLRLGDYDDAAK